VFVFRPARRAPEAASTIAQTPRCDRDECERGDVFFSKTIDGNAVILISAGMTALSLQNHIHAAANVSRARPPEKICCNAAFGPPRRRRRQPMVGPEPAIKKCE
jgi:hypothetical protein